MKILIATGIYPPQTSGPAQYAYEMNNRWQKAGHSVRVVTYGFEKYIPTGLRHLYFFVKILPSVLWADRIFTLDTFSVGLPSVLASKVFGKKCIIRTGGDFLWEGYVERTGDKVLLRDFYLSKNVNLNIKEKIIFSLSKWTLRNAYILVFSTDWQKNIFLKPYNLENLNTLVIENHYEKVDVSVEKNILNKNFISATRPLVWKNIDFLKSVFVLPEVFSSGAILDEERLSHEEFLEKIKKSYAVILVSLGDISPHMILDAISCCTPFIVTEENGLMNRVADIAITVNPKNLKDIKEKILWLSNDDNYKFQLEKIKNFSFVRTWDDVAKDYLNIFEK